MSDPTSYIEWVRSRVGKRKIFLAFSSILLRSETGGILLQRRTDFNTWGLPGGILELKESIWDCAHRELREETGLSSGELSLVGVYSDPQWDVVYPNGDQVQQYTVCFQGRADGGEMRPDRQEASEQRFFTPEEIPYESIAGFYQAMIRDALAGGPPAFSPPYAGPETSSQTELMRELAGREPFIGVSTAAVILGEGAAALSDAASLSDAAALSGRILMVQRADDGEWDFPGGYLDLGENAAHAVQREAREELGLEIEPEAILGIHSPAYLWPYPLEAQVQRVATVFRARITGGRLKDKSEEVSGSAWLAPEEILRQGGKPALVALKRAVIAALEGAPWTGGPLFFG
jgi:ADP-ribose pyrophosphatase YjhB (NUDIX family)